MAINIQNLVAAANAKIAAGASDAADSARLDTLATLVANHENALTFKSITDLPTADSSNAGLIFRVAPLVNGAYTDSSSNFYLSYRGQWKPLSFTDSAVTEGQFRPLQGSNFGYVSGGNPGPINVIEKFSLTSDANATDVGDLTVARFGVTGQSSSVSGYTSAGKDASTFSNVIDKFPFASDGNATDVGDVTVGRYLGTGQSSSDNGYNTGGRYPTYSNVIEKFSFASDGNATDVGDTVSTLYGPAGQNSPSTGYVSGGTFPPTDPEGFYANVIQKFPFASDANATNVADLTVGRRNVAGQSSTVSGYTSGGVNPGDANAQTTIDKFPFSSDTNATDVGDQLVNRYGAAGQSSTASGYISGGIPNINQIQKFSFSSDGNATDVADLTAAKNYSAGQQY